MTSTKSKVITQSLYRKVSKFVYVHACYNWCGYAKDKQKPNKVYEKNEREKKEENSLTCDFKWEYNIYTYVI